MLRDAPSDPALSKVDSGDRRASTWLRVWAWPIAVAILVPVLAISLWPSPARSSTVQVHVDVPASGLPYTVAPDGLLRSANGADYKGRSFEVTTLEITISDVRDEGGAETLDVSFNTPGGTEVRCGPTSPLWTAGGAQTLQCTPFVAMDQLSAISAVQVFGQ